MFPYESRANNVSLNLGILLALACAVATQLGFLYKHRGANEAPAVDIRHPLRSGRALFSQPWLWSGNMTLLCKQCMNRLHQVGVTGERLHRGSIIGL